MTQPKPEEPAKTDEVAAAAAAAVAVVAAEKGGEDAPAEQEAPAPRATSLPGAARLDQSRGEQLEAKKDIIH